MYRILIALAVSAGLALPSGFQSPDLMKLRAVGTVQFSPDGTRIAYSITRNDTPRRPIGQLWIMTIADGKSVCLCSEKEPSGNPEWSPDNKRIAFNDNQLNLWDVEIATAKLTKIDTDQDYSLDRDIAWSGDSKWLAFSKYMPNREHALFVYSFESGKSTQVTDGMSDARSPAFDRDGRMCLCGVLGAEAGALTPEVADVILSFFCRCIEDLSQRIGGPRAKARAFHVMATLEGGMMLARAYGNIEAFDLAAADLV